MRRSVDGPAIRWLVVGIHCQAFLRVNFPAKLPKCVFIVYPHKVRLLFTLQLWGPWHACDRGSKDHYTAPPHPLELDSFSRRSSICGLITRHLLKTNARFYVSAVASCCCWHKRNHANEWRKLSKGVTPSAETGYPGTLATNKRSSGCWLPLNLELVETKHCASHSFKSEVGKWKFVQKNNYSAFKQVHIVHQPQGIKNQRSTVHFYCYPPQVPKLTPDYSTKQLN